MPFLVKGIVFRPALSEPPCSESDFLLPLPASVAGTFSIVFSHSSFPKQFSSLDDAICGDAVLAGYVIMAGVNPPSNHTPPR